MNLNSLKEQLIELLEKISNIARDSSLFNYLQEKYTHLSRSHRRIMYLSLGVVFLVSILYYPVKNFYLSVENTVNISNTQQLTKKLLQFSTKRQTLLDAEIKEKDLFNSPNFNVQSFLEQKIKKLNFPPNQVVEIKRIENIENLISDFPSAMRAQGILIAMENLNIQEVIQYGQRLENLSKNLKLLGLNIEENPIQKKYFTTSYSLVFFTKEVNDDISQ